MNCTNFELSLLFLKQEQTDSRVRIIVETVIATNKYKYERLHTLSYILMFPTEIVS